MNQERHAAIDAIIEPVADAFLSMDPASGIGREEIMDMLYPAYMRATLQITVSMLEAAADMVRDELQGATADEIAQRVRTFIPLGGSPSDE